MEAKGASIHDDFGTEPKAKMDSSISDIKPEATFQSQSNATSSGEPVPVQGYPGKKRGGRKTKAPTDNANESGFLYSSHAKDKHGKPIYGCDFYQKSQTQYSLFATVSSNRVKIYECLPNVKTFKLLQCFEDPDKEEDFYTCAWTNDPEGNPLLAAAGVRGIIRIFSPKTASHVKAIVGHGNAINTIVFHPKDPNLLLSASKDQSIRLWNVKTDKCVAIFGGVQNQYAQILSADIDMNGSRMVSCGMDHSLKVWDLKDPKIENAIELSYSFKGQNVFPTARQFYPMFTHQRVHWNYVDCVKWIGNIVLSKSCDGRMVGWIPNAEAKTVFNLGAMDCNYWFMKFAIHFATMKVALGNNKGKLFVYDLKKPDPAEFTTSILAHPKCTGTIRQTCFSPDGTILICVCEDSTIWRWDIKKEQCTVQEASM